MINMTRYKIGDTIIFNSFGKAKKMIIDNVIDTSDGNPLYEDEYGSGVFESDIILGKTNE